MAEPVNQADQNERDVEETTRLVLGDSPLAGAKEKAAEHRKQAEVTGSQLMSGTPGPTPQPKDSFHEMLNRASEEVGKLDRARSGGPEIPDKYRGKSAEELVGILGNVESDRGRLAQEVGELRKLRETPEYPQPQYQQPTDLAPITPYDDVSAAQWEAFEEEVYEQMETDPVQAVGLAMQSGNAELIETAMDAWHELEPRKAAQYERQAERMMERQAYTEAMVGQANLVQAHDAVKSRHEDFDELDAEMSEIAMKNPEMLMQLNARTPEARERVIEGLYLAAKHKIELNEAVPHVTSASYVPGAEPGKKRDPLYNLVERVMEDTDLSKIQ